MTLLIKLIFFNFLLNLFKLNNIGVEKQILLRKPNNGYALARNLDLVPALRA